MNTWPLKKVCPCGHTHPCTQNHHHHHHCCMHNDQVGMTQLSSVFTKSALPFFICILVIVTTINLTIITDDSSGNEGKPLLYIHIQAGGISDVNNITTTYSWNRLVRWFMTIFCRIHLRCDHHGQVDPKGPFRVRGPVGPVGLLASDLVGPGFRRAD